MTFTYFSQLGSSALNKMSNQSEYSKVTKNYNHAVNHLKAMATTPRCFTTSTPVPTPCAQDLSNLSAISIATRGIDVITISDDECDIIGPFCSSMIYPQGSTPKPQRKRMACHHGNNIPTTTSGAEEYSELVNVIADFSRVVKGTTPWTENAEVTVVNNGTSIHGHSKIERVGQCKVDRKSLASDLKHSSFYTTALDSDATMFMRQPIVRRKAITSSSSHRVKKLQNMNREKRRSILNKMKEFKKTLRCSGKNRSDNMPVLAVL